MLRVCLSGGPCGGKSSARSALTEIFTNRGYKVLFCPETATELIVNGIIPSNDISIEEFQEFVLDKQLAKEELYNKIALSYDIDKVIILYDRGLCDQMAYISKDKFEKLLENKNMTLSDAYAHYDCVLHLVTTADGAIEYYEWNDPSKKDCGNNAARSESPEEAIKKDRLTKNAWIGHPHLRIFDNSSTFENKINRIVNEICNVLGEPIPNEIERKFLIKMPTNEQIKSLGCVSKTNIIQTYLKSNNDIERRVRQRGTKQDGFTFYYTEKRNNGKGSREEFEKIITPNEYINYLSEADSSLKPIHKNRYCFLYDNKYYEMDIYPFSEKYAILEIELNSIDELINLPNDKLNIIKEVTDDIHYKNNYLAKTFKFIDEF